jgi:hypothetical protein
LLILAQIFILVDLYVTQPYHTDTWEKKQFWHSHNRASDFSGIGEEVATRADLK